MSGPNVTIARWPFFVVQDEITESVVGALQPQLYAAENLRFRKKAPESLDAWGCVMRAMPYVWTWAAADNEAGVKLLERADAIDPLMPALPACSAGLTPLAPISVWPIRPKCWQGRWRWPSAQSIRTTTIHGLTLRRVTSIWWPANSSLQSINLVKPSTAIRVLP